VAIDRQALDKVRAIARDVVEFEGMEMVHLEMKSEPRGWLLRLYIDKESGVTLDDCSRISRLLSTQLDVEDPIPHRYTLEVSSPGLDRPLSSDGDFTRFTGRTIRLSTYAPLDGRRNFVGRLVGLVDGAVRLELDGGIEVAIPRDQVAKARLEIETDGFRPGAGARGRKA
jgi:ribosome maturation factor RimP